MEGDFQGASLLSEAFKRRDKHPDSLTASEYIWFPVSSISTGPRPERDDGARLAPVTGVKNVAPRIVALQYFPAPFVRRGECGADKLRLVCTVECKGAIRVTGSNSCPDGVGFGYEAK